MTQRVLWVDPLRLMNFETAVRDLCFKTNIELPSPLIRMDEGLCIRILAKELNISVNFLAADQGFYELLEKAAVIVSDEPDEPDEEFGNFSLREDGGFSIREDGGRELRE